MLSKPTRVKDSNEVKVLATSEAMRILLSNFHARLIAQSDSSRCNFFGTSNR